MRERPKEGAREHERAQNEQRRESEGGSTKSKHIDIELLVLKERLQNE